MIAWARLPRMMSRDGRLRRPYGWSGLLVQSARHPFEYNYNLLTARDDALWVPVFLNHVQIDGQTTYFVPPKVRSFSFSQRPRCPRLTPPTALTFPQESTQNDPPRPRFRSCHIFVFMLRLPHPTHRNPSLASSPSQPTRLPGNYTLFFPKPTYHQIYRPNSDCLHSSLSHPQIKHISGLLLSTFLPCPFLYGK